MADIVGTVGSDELVGTPESDNINGDAGDDTLDGGEGDDFLYGEGGDDTLIGGAGADYMDGGDGIDTADYSGESSGIEIRFLDFTFTGINGGAAEGDVHVSIENVIGTSFDDQFWGTLTGEDNIFWGGDGRDGFAGFGGNDTFYGQAGDDFMSNQSGNEYYDGGDGFDIVSYEFGVDNGTGATVDLTAAGGVQQASAAWGADTLLNVEAVIGTIYDDVITGDDAANYLYGFQQSTGGVTGSNTDTILAGGGDDTVVLGIGDHTADGGAGNDTITLLDPGYSGESLLDLNLQGAAQDTGMGLMTLSGFENASTGLGNDELIGDTNDNMLGGSGGNDTLRGSIGHDTLYGDSYFTIIDGIGGVEFARVEASAGDDTLDGGEGDDFLYGEGGDDTLIGGAGADYMDGGEGVDTADYSGASEGIMIRGFTGFNMGGAAEGDTHVSIENIVGTAFDDVLWGTFAGEDNIFWGGDGTDSFNGFGGNDQFFGEGGYDYAVLGSSDELYDGGDGFDLVSYYWTDLGAGVIIDLRVEEQTSGAFGTDTLVNVEGAQGTRYDDVFYGTSESNHFWGSESFGSANNNDQAYMGAGDDHVLVGIGNHVVDGGEGNDTLRLTDPAMISGVVVSLEMVGIDQEYGHGTINISGIENLSGSEHADVLTGDGTANVLTGDLGDDELQGAGGSDTLFGDSRIALYVLDTPAGLGWDVIPPEGPEGNDILNGGDGDDILYGEGGDDTLIGGEGADSFMIGVNSGNDTILDFDSQDRVVFDEDLEIESMKDLAIVDTTEGASVAWGDGSNSLLFAGVSADDLSPFDFGLTPPVPDNVPDGRGPPANPGGGRPSGRSSGKQLDQSENSGDDAELQSAISTIEETALMDALIDYYSNETIISPSASSDKAISTAFLDVQLVLEPSSIASSSANYMDEQIFLDMPVAQIL
ncbi:calcium-binding protein [Erythrobacter alti]|uniref:calcium-binding protein n=1 Tax=Erythrobacter alti TaxID=1896145 RepID=UPI0030F489B8